MISIVGTINCTFLKLKDVLNHTLGFELVKDKIRIIGEEITYSNSELELYIYSLDCKDRYEDSVDDYQFECRYNGSKIDAGVLILKLGEEIRKWGYMSVFEIGECDNTGKSENDDIILRFIPNK
jgi:hypothetical protein